MRALAFTGAACALLVVVVVAPAALGQAGQSSPALGERPPSASPRPQVNENKIVVRYKDGIPAIAGLVHSSTLGDEVEVQPRSKLHVIDVPKGADAAALVTGYQDDPLVEEVNISHIVRVFEAPNDTNYSYQWHMHNTVGGMHAEAAWPLAPNAGQGVVVAVIDSGVAYEAYDGSLGGVFPQHFALAPDLAGTTFVDPWDFVYGDAHANDDNGHGSHVTGTITQETNDNYGVAGVAYNSTIMPLKVIDFSGFGEDVHAVEAIHYAVDHGADVISMSIGFTGTGTPDAVGTYCTEIVGLGGALDYAAAHNVVVVAAAGNDSGGPVSCPAAYPSVISVGATRFDGQVAQYSNTGATLDVTAPGGDPNIDQNGDGFSDGVVQETYCYDSLSLLFLGAYDAFCDIFMSGTSMAAPHVAGLAALLLGEDPSLTPSQVRSYIESTARDRGASGWDPGYGWGVIDAEAAVASLSGATPAPTLTPTSPATATATPTLPPPPTDTPMPPTPSSTPVPPTPTPSPIPATPTPTAGQPGPDLIETFVSDPPATAARRGRFYVTDTVRNVGNARAAQSTTRYYLSLDQSISASDRRLTGSRGVSALNPSVTSTGTVRVTIPGATTQGSYYLLACADDRLNVAESNETNNCRASATRIQVT